VSHYWDIFITAWLAIDLPPLFLEGGKYEENNVNNAYGFDDIVFHHPCSG